MSYEDRLAEYEDVPGRMRQFFADHPEGSLGPVDPTVPFEVRDVAGKTFVVYTAVAKRGPNDGNPGYGCAWEPFPGTTPYTENSELQNAETSAWGRALVALGYVAKKVASAEEVAARQSERGGQGGGDSPARPAQANGQRDENPISSGKGSQNARLYAIAMQRYGDHNLAVEAIRLACVGVAGIEDSRQLPRWAYEDVVEVVEGKKDFPRPSDIPANTEGLPEPGAQAAMAGTTELGGEPTPNF